MATYAGEWKAAQDVATSTVAVGEDRHTVEDDDRVRFGNDVDTSRLLGILGDVGMTFRFNGRDSRARGLLFYRLLHHDRHAADALHVALAVELGALVLSDDHGLPNAHRSSADCCRTAAAARVKCGGQAVTT